MPNLDLGKKTLMAEALGILRWMIDGCLDCYQNHLSRLATVLAATETSFEEQDVLSQWVAEECDHGASWLSGRAGDVSIATYDALAHRRYDR